MDPTPILMFIVVFGALLMGYPVAATLAGTALIFAFLGILTGAFNIGDLGFLAPRVFGIITNPTLIAIPLFVLMGILLERSKIAERLLDSMSVVFGRLPGGLGLGVCLVGMLLAASTGIVGATVVAMGLMSLPSMLKHGYDPKLATGVICATGTLGQIIPPSIVLVLLGDVLSNAYQQAQLAQGLTEPKTVSVGDLFAGALIPGLLLVGFYFVYVFAVAVLQPTRAPRISLDELGTEQRATGGLGEALRGLLPPLVLIIAVLGSILTGIATPTEAAGVGALGATILALLYRQLSFIRLKESLGATLETTSMVFFILIGASVFSLVFRAYGGDELIAHWFDNLPGGMWGALALVMLVIFLLGFMLDFIEIIAVVVPVVGPVLLGMGIDPIWLGILIALNLQTSFLTPPFGFALFYLRGVAPPSVKTFDIYRGVIPFIGLQLLMLLIVMIWPRMATWLPAQLQ